MPQSSPAQDLGNGVTRETLMDGRIVAFTVTKMTRVSIDTWVDAQRAEMINWPAGSPICILKDQSTMINLTHTPYMKSRLSDLTSGSHGKSGRAAIVFGRGFLLQFAKMLANSQTSKSNMKIKFFSDRESALAWLQEILEPVAKPA